MEAKEIEELPRQNALQCTLTEAYTSELPVVYRAVLQGSYVE